MAEVLSEQTVVTVAPGQISSTLAGEEVILNLETGIYYSLNPMGAHIWSLLATPKTISAVCEAILAEFDVERWRCLQDVQVLLGQMIDAQLVEVVHDPMAEAAATPAD